MKNNQGIAHLGIFIAVIAIGVLAVFFVVMQKPGTNMSPRPTPDPITDIYNSDGEMVSPSPISEDTDNETLQKELDATVVGDFEADINSMESEASEL